MTMTKAEIREFVDGMRPMLQAWAERERDRHVLRVCDDCQHEISTIDRHPHVCPPKPSH